MTQFPPSLAIHFRPSMHSQIEFNALVNWAVLPAANAERLFDEPEINDAIVWTSSLTTDEKTELLASLANRLADMDAAKASALLVFGGGLVESGASPDALLPAGLHHLADLRQLHAAGHAPEEDTWRFAVIGLMAMLCRSASGRALLKRKAQLLTWLEENEELSDHFGYLLRIAEISDEDVLWVLFPAYETGLEVSISQINNTFHLLTLLQPLVLAHAAELKLQTRPELAAPELLRFAQGDRTAPHEGVDSGLWEWLNALAYQGGPLDSGQVAWGEASVSSLPRVRGRVVLLATENENRMTRSWDAGFLATMHDANRPDVQLRRLLPAHEVRELLDEMHAPVAAPAPVTEAARSFWQRLRGK